MGHTSVGISCKDVMAILDDEAYDAAQAVVEETDKALSLDMVIIRVCTTLIDLF